MVEIGSKELFISVLLRFSAELSSVTDYFGLDLAGSYQKPHVSELTFCVWKKFDKYVWDKPALLWLGIENVCYWILL